MAIFEAAWECPSCHAEVLGRHASCPACGASQPEDVKFFLPHGSSAVTDSELLADARSGVDWHCDHCGSNNPASTTRCTACGNPRDEADIARKVIDYGAKEAPATGAEARDLARDKKLAQDRERRANRVASGNVRSAPGSRPPGRRSLLIVALLAGLVLLAGLMVFLLTPRASEAVVADMRWERTLPIEELQTFREADWRAPAGARMVSSERRIRTYQDVIDHYETRTRSGTRRVESGTETYDCGMRDLGNGYFETKTCTRPAYKTESYTESYKHPVYRKEPVWDTWRTYDIDRWTVVRTHKTRGGEDEPMEWPRSDARGKRERDGARIEVYQVTLRDPDGKPFLRNVDQATFDRLDKGQVLPVKTRMMGASREVLWPGTR